MSDLPPITILIVYLGAAATGAAAYATGRLTLRIVRGIRARRSRRHPVNRDVPHDRIDLTPAERAEWLQLWAAFTREALAEERARMQGGSGEQPS